MTRVLQLVSGLALLATIAPPVLFLGGALDAGTMKAWMAVATVAWFAATPAWMGKSAT